MFNRVTTIILALELLLILVAFRFVSWTPVKAAGAGIMVAAMLLLITARRQLGRSFSVRAKASRLVTTGVYARIRNPIYVASVLFFGGVALFFQTWWLTAPLLLLIALQWKRAGNEAKVLHRQFGEEYLSYRRRTWF